MSKCIECGNKLLTGDIHWEMGLCNNCYNKLYKNHKSHISLDKMWLEIANNFRTDNEKLQERIAELEEQLKNSIRPKFKVGQEIWCIRFMKIIKFKINKIEIYRGESEEENRILYSNWEDMIYQIEENCFTTKAEAEVKLEKLREKNG